MHGAGAARQNRKSDFFLARFHGRGSSGNSNGRGSLLQRIGGAECIGPLLTGLSKPVHVLQRGSEVNDIVHVAAVAVVDAQEVGKPYRTLGAAVRR